MLEDMRNDCTEIERRAEALESKHDDPTHYAVRSHVGFLGKGEKLKDRLQQDWVQNMFHLQNTSLYLTSGFN